MLKRETFLKSFWNIQRNCRVLLVPNQKVYKEASKDWNRKCVTACFVQVFRILKNCFLKFISNNLIKNFVDFCIIFMDRLQLFAFSLRCVQLESASCGRRLLQLVHGYLTKFINDLNINLNYWRKNDNSVKSDQIFTILKAYSANTASAKLKWKYQIFWKLQILVHVPTFLMAYQVLTPTHKLNVKSTTICRKVCTKLLFC